MAPVSTIGVFSSSMHANHVTKGNAFPYLRTAASTTGGRSVIRRSRETRSAARESAELAGEMRTRTLLCTLGSLEGVHESCAAAAVARRLQLVRGQRDDALIADFVPDPPLLDGKPQRKWNAVALAFLGDSVWELYIRRQGMLSAKKLKDLYSWTRDRVVAESQSECFVRLHEGSFLTKTEREILRWGKNTKKASMPRRLKGGLSVEIYRQSTAIECLIGYLYLADPTRLHSLMDHLQLVENAE